MTHTVLSTTGLNLSALARSPEDAAPAWVADLKRSAVARFEEHGFPTVHDEDWKYTDVSPVTSGSVVPTVDHLSPTSVEQVRQRLAGLSIGVPLCVFINGRLVPGLSALRGLPTEVQFASFRDESGRGWSTAEGRLNRLSSHLTPFAVLNSALFTDGAVLEFGNGTRFETPIHIVFVSTDTTDRGAAYPRLLICMGDDSEGTVAETHLALGASPAFADAVTEIVLGPGAILAHSRIVSGDEGSLHIGATEVLLERDSSYRSLQLQSGGRLVRCDLNVTFAGEGADCVLNGAYIGSGVQHLDNHTMIDHAVPRCTSRQLYKGIVGDSATAVFNGKVVVRPDAHKTDAGQTNKNLVLSSHATVNAKPQLEILNDDVRCAHGAAIGPPDDETLFYLRSRGLDIEAATGLFSYGFAADVVRSGAPPALRPLADAVLRDAVAAAVKSPIPF